MQDQDLNQNKNTIPLTDKGKHFAMDFGFVRGSEFSEKTKDGRTITSVDGFNSYLIIVDKASRYMFTFLTKSKHPPLDIVKSFLTRHGHPSSVGKTIRTDQGNELAGSSAFRELIDSFDYNLEVTAPRTSKKNRIAERPNRTLSQMMRCMLHSANMGSQYWSYALVHATYVKIGYRIVI